MDRPAAARALTRRAPRLGRRGSTFVLAVAAPDDDADVRGLMRAAALPGAVRLSFEREPDSLAAGRIEGDEHAILVARDGTTGCVAAIASRSSRSRFVNGRVARVGYLSGFRVAPGSGATARLLDQGFSMCRDLEARDPVELYLASVVADHTSARRRLEQGRPGWPRFRPVDELVTLAIPAGGNGRPLPGGLEIRRGDQAGLPSVIELLARCNSRYQLAPHWTAADVASSAAAGPGFEHFMVAVKRGRITGCAALWDQRAVRQVVVRGYARWMARWRPVINTVGRAIGVPRLPPVNSALAFAYLSHFAVEDDDEEVGVALVAAARARARAAGLDYIALGLSERHPLCGILRRAFRHRAYQSVLYAGGWPHHDMTADRLDGRPAHPEVAVL